MPEIRKLPTYDVTVVSPCGPGGAKTTAHAAKSLTKQDRTNITWHISADGVPVRDVWVGLDDGPPKIAKRTQVFDTGRQSGSAEAKMIGSLGIRTPYVAFMDIDDEFLKNGLTKLLDAMNEHRTWWAVGGKELIFPEGRAPGLNVGPLAGRWGPGALFNGNAMLRNPRFAPQGMVVRTPVMRLAGIPAFPVTDDNAIFSRVAALSSGVILEEPVYGYRRGPMNPEGSQHKTQQPDYQRMRDIWYPASVGASQELYTAAKAMGFLLDEYPGPLGRAPRHVRAVRRVAKNLSRGRPM